jgi:hypothetical protein
MSCVCDICELKLSHIKNITKHQNTDKCQTIKRLLDKKEKIYINKNKKLEEDNIFLNNKNNENFNIINNLTKQLENLKQELITKNTQFDLLQDKYEDLRKIVEKAATKSTNTVKNYNHNNYLNYISAEPIKFNEIKSQLKQIVNCETVMYDEDDFHDHIVDNILKDKNGKDKVLCTDINRKNFTYKDENTGQLISDPELDNLRTKLRNGIKLKQVRNELLEKLKKDYEDNGNVGKDPYVKFYEMIQKLNFGVPFVDHVAKKTYVKSKNNDIKTNNSKMYTNENIATNIGSGNQIENMTITELTDKDTLESTGMSHKSQTINRNGKEYVSISHISDEKIRELFTEEEYLEYQELVKEFGKELICD